VKIFEYLNKWIEDTEQINITSNRNKNQINKIKHLTKSSKNRYLYNKNKKSKTN